ncbi:hypothetical protein JAAARDRAFT_197766 [Jaapia argillacea MUCL 33604]|uniref:E3 ubiquitin-protein ligase n=1 Tax=Jaapia argillacea MUCL 33604 TaxID=933084 RepID=A0A067PRM7_9AGAM|nr:hypothetical protein JAAARDRAFT_197766 [Jaapia argillacea MUCL 33604]
MTPSQPPPPPPPPSTSTATPTSSRTQDPLSRLRYFLETLPQSRKYTFTPSVRSEILSEVYSAFWGPYAHLFLPNSNSSLPMGALLGEVQAKLGFGGAGGEEEGEGGSCGHIFKRGESCFRCKDCALDDSCVLCSKCFHASNHTDHNVSFFIAQQSGGSCDCGDPEAWQNPISCPFHLPSSSSEVEGEGEGYGPSIHTTPKAIPRSISSSSSSSSPTPTSSPAPYPPPLPSYPHRVPLPPTLQPTIQSTLSLLLDFILSTLSLSPPTTTLPTTLSALHLQPTADPLSKDLWCVVVWNDDKHSFGEVGVLLRDCCGMEGEEVGEIVGRVDEEGREVVLMGGSGTGSSGTGTGMATAGGGGTMVTTARLLEIAQMMHQTDLGITVRRAYDTFREQIVGVLIEFLLDLTHARIGTDAVVLREILAQVLLERKPLPADLQGPAVVGGEEEGVGGVMEELRGIEDPRRLDWLFLFHTRLWKKPRLSLKEVYVGILNLGHEHKLAIASRFANVYHRVIDAYLLVDREAETSIKYFALQLFTVPSIALHIVKEHNLIVRLLNIITAFFTNQIKNNQILSVPVSSQSTSVGSGNSSLGAPSSGSGPGSTTTTLSLPSTPIDPEAFPFKSKRFMPVFSDLRYLSHTPPILALIPRSPQLIGAFVKCCALFMCLNANRRVGGGRDHVEFESDAWISVFNVTLSLSRVIKVWGEAFGGLEVGGGGFGGGGGRRTGSGVGELVGAIGTVIHHILMVCTLSNDILDRTKFQPIAFHTVTFSSTSYQTVHFDVLEGWVSFHHSLHWLLAELFKHVELLSEERLEEVGLGSLRDVLLRNASERAVLTVVDFPLRVLAMIAQIRTGLWVRNGFAIRGQLLHYRDFMLRELCYDQDLFIVQTALVVLDPDLVMVSILDRFQLLDYFSGATVHPVYEGAQLMSMVEEVLYVFITILSEKANAAKLPLPVAVRREIVHALAVGPCTFTDLVKRVAERMVDDVCFERVLKQVATFKPPESISDSGMYELKDEVFDEVNPFFYHYTRNKREEVETVLKARAAKKGGKKGVGSGVIVPKPLDIAFGPFAVLAHTFESEALLQVMFYAVHNILELTASAGTPPPSGEAILDQALHLIMLAIVERAEVFSHLCGVKSFDDQKTLIDVLCTLEHHEQYKTYKERVDWILTNIARHAPEEVRARRRVIDLSGDQPPNAEEEKKRAAKARQAAIMKQMKAQQASFAINFEDVEDEDGDEDLGETPEEPVSYGTCIVCQEELNSTKAFGTLGLLQPSRLLRRQPDGQQSYFHDVLQTPLSLDRSPSNSDGATFPPQVDSEEDAKVANTPSFDGFPPQSTRFGVHGSICNHMMHLDCFQVYSISVRQRHRAQATRNHPENIPRKEYICPLCKSLGNVIMPLALPAKAPLNPVPFPDWIRASGISILKSKPDPLLDSLQFRNGTGEFVFWGVQDPGYVSYSRHPDKWENMELHKMVDTVVVITKSISQQTRHLRDRPEPESTERGAGIYLPEELVGYTIASMEAAQRGSGSPGTLISDTVPETQMRCIRGLIACLSKLSALQFKGRADDGREAVRQAIIKRLLPEWSRTSLTSFSYPLLLRDPFTILIETAAVAPDMLRQVLILTYYAYLARTVVGLVFLCTKTRTVNTPLTGHQSYEDIFGDVRMFFMSVARHSPVFEHSATLALQTFGEERLERLMYTFTLPFLRRAAILCRAILPSAFPTPSFGADEQCEYRRLLTMLDIPPLSELPNQDTLQNCLSGWCAHYGHSHAASQFNCAVNLDHPGIYRIANLPLVLDNLFVEYEKAVKCPRCKTVPFDAAICLICGTTCCIQSHCCSDQELGKGECNMHTRECGGAIGIYFLVRRCAVLYIYATNGTFASPPYLDVHGEVDISMRRGRRQYLHQARWEEVRKTWLTHGIPTLVARKLESTVDSGGWESL